MDGLEAELDDLERIVCGLKEPDSLDFKLLRGLTENFSDDRRIGEGGCGELYKGILPNGVVIAVKKLRNSHTIDEKMFLREVDSMIKVGHQNIVRFLGYCSETKEKALQMDGRTIMAEERERLLCFEYIRKGSIDNYLTDELRGFEWHTRYQIIRGICNGLLHLHKEKGILHMDLKPANILLGDETVPKITDFGQSRIDGKSQTTSAQLLLSPGYCAPEYMNGKWSWKSDIYSLGVIITELVTGSRQMPNTTKVLRRWRHRWNKSSKPVPLWYQQVKNCLELALSCKENNPINRPLIEDVVRELNKLDSWDGQVEESSLEKIICSSDDMLGIEPLELHLPFTHEKQVSCSIELTNDTDHHMAFRIATTSLLPFTIKPGIGIAAPRSKCRSSITLSAQEMRPLHNHRTEFIVQSTRIDGSVTAVDITVDTFNDEGGNSQKKFDDEDKVVDEVNLTVVFDMPLLHEEHQKDLVNLMGSIGTSSQVAMVSKTLSEIRPGKELWKIKARVTRVWDAILLGSGEQISLDMILIDHQGTKMHGIINKVCMEKFKALIEEGKVYIIANVKVTTAAQKYRPVENDKVLNFLPTTTIKKIKDTQDIPKHSFQFFTIDMLSNRVNIDTYLSDIIGVAAHIGPVEETRTNFGLTKIRDIVLLIDGQEVKVRFWGAKVEQIDEGAKSRVIAITSTTMKKFGRYSLSSTNATQVFVDLPIPEAMNARNSIPSSGISIEEIHIDDHLKGTLEEQMQYNRRTLEELGLILYDSSNQDKIFTAEATISAINANFGWYYISCSRGDCKKQLDKKFDHYYCSKCGKKVEPKARYKIKLEVRDPTSTATCVLFEKEALMLISESADSLITSANYDIKAVPKQIQEICDQTLIFQFRLTEYNFTSLRPNYTVSRLFLNKEKCSSRIHVANTEKEKEYASKTKHGSRTTSSNKKKRKEKRKSAKKSNQEEEWANNSEVYIEHDLSSGKRTRKESKKISRGKRRSQKEMTKKLAAAQKEHISDCELRADNEEKLMTKESIQTVKRRKKARRNVITILDSVEESMQAEVMNATKRICEIEDSDEEMYETNISMENNHEEEQECTNPEEETDEDEFDGESKTQKAPKNKKRRLNCSKNKRETNTSEDIKIEISGVENQENEHPTL